MSKQVLLDRYIEYPFHNARIITAVWVEDNTAHSLLLVERGNHTIARVNDGHNDAGAMDLYFSDGFCDLPEFVFVGNFEEDSELLMKDYRKALAEAVKLTKVL